MSHRRGGATCDRWLFVMLRKSWRSTPPHRRWIFVLLLVLQIGVIHYYSGGRSLHDTAETLGAMGAIVATFFVAATLLLQSKELRLQRRELHETRVEFERQSEQFTKQTSLLELANQREIARHSPSLAASFQWLPQPKGPIRSPAHATIVIQNVGMSPVHKLQAMPMGDRSVQVPHTDEAVISPGGTCNLKGFLLDHLLESEDCARLPERLDITFLDELGGKHTWKFRLGDLENSAILRYPIATAFDDDSPAGASPVTPSNPKP